MILLSGIHFEGQWKFPFNTSFTREENFYDVNETPIGRVPMMFHRGPFPYVAIAELECHVIELPYGHSNELSMIVMLPRKGLDLKSAIENLKRVGLQKIISELNKSVEEYEDEEAEIFLPRFTTLTQFNLVEGLKIVSFFFLFHPDLLINILLSIPDGNHRSIRQRFSQSRENCLEQISLCFLVDPEN